MSALEAPTAEAAPINGARGEVALTIDGAPRRLCLTLGALAELETEFRVTGMAALGARLAATSARDLLVVLAALLRGGGAPMTVRDLMRASLDPVAASEAVAAAFSAAATDSEPKP